MTTIRQSTRTISVKKVRELKERAKRIDRDEASSIQSRGRAIFAQHERLRAILEDLIAERKRQGLSLNDLAQRTGIAKPNLSRLENRRSMSPTLPTLQQYAHALGKAVHVELVNAERAG